MSDDQEIAETVDEDVLGDPDLVLSDEARWTFPPTHLHGTPFADSDVTDESLDDRLAQEEPEVWELPTAADEAIDPDAPSADDEALEAEERRVDDEAIAADELG